LPSSPTSTTKRELSKSATARFDDHLDAIAETETADTVLDAIAERRDDSE